MCTIKEAIPLYELITTTPPTERDNFVVEMLGAVEGDEVRGMIVIHLLGDADNPYMTSSYNVTANDWAAAAGYCNLEAAALLMQGNDL